MEPVKKGALIMSNPKHRIKIYTPDSHILIGVLIITENNHWYLEFKKSKSSEKEVIPLDVFLMLITSAPLPQSSNSSDNCNDEVDDSESDSFKISA